MCSVLGILTSMALLNYEVLMIGAGVPQPGVQPRPGSNPALESGCPNRILLDRRDKVARQ